MTPAQVATYLEFRAATFPSLSLALLVAAVVAISGCGGGGNSATVAGTAVVPMVPMVPVVPVGGSVTLTITVSDVQNSGSKVTEIVTGVSCPGTCSGSIPSGTSVTLTAVPTAGYGLSSWGGLCAGTATLCTFTMTANQSATVSFHPQATDVWWVSTSGSDSNNNGRTINTAFKTFNKALTSMSGGDTLYVGDGTYKDSLGAFGGNFSQEFPDGTAPKFTRVIGYNRHAVTVDGEFLRVPLQIFKGNFIEINNMVFLRAGLSNNPVFVSKSSNLYIHNVGAAYADPTCSNCQSIAITESNNVTVEDAWAWGFGGRYPIMLWHGNNNIVRRTVTRFDGAKSAGGEPKAGLALYSEINSIAENNITLDFNGAGNDGLHAALFTTSTSFPLGDVFWYGNIAINTKGDPNFGGVFLVDSLNPSIGTVTAVNNVLAQSTAGAGSSAGPGMWAESGGASNGGSGGNIRFRHNTVYNINGATSSTGRAVRIDTAVNWPSVIFNDNLISTANSCFNDLNGAISAQNNQKFNCTVADQEVPGTGLLVADPQLLYLLRRETGAPGKGTASDGGDRGATIVNRYKSTISNPNRFIDGVLTGTPLWPFPNEDIIKQDMCTLAGVTTGWCGTTKTLTKYIWEFLGNPSPF